MGSSAARQVEQLKTWIREPQRMVRELFGVVPDAWQDEALAAFPTSPRLAMSACKGPGKAQPKTTLVPTPDGVVPIGDLRPGDEVFAGDGSVTRVSAVYDRGTLPVYRVSFDDGSATEACGEHLWKVRGRTERRHDTWSILTTEEIISRGVREKNGEWSGRHFEIPRQGAAQFGRKYQSVDPYVLGVWLGDGVRLKGAYATKPTAEIAEEICRRGLNVSEPRDGLVTVYGISPWLADLGVLPLYSHERYVPPQYLMGDIEQRRAILCGLMDTDGGIGDDGHMEFSSTSRRLAEDVVWLARSLGGVGFIKAKVKQPYYRNPAGEIVHGKPCYRVTVCLPFNPFLVAHRRERWKDPLRSASTVRYLTRKLDAIELAGEADCCCIQIEHETGLYLTTDFIVTHNTALLAWLGWNFLLTRLHPRIGAISITGDNLQANLWTELAVWRKRSPLLESQFEQTKTAIFHRRHPDTWKLEARSWPKTATREEIGQVLAGLHAPYVMWLADESGGYPAGILPALEAIFAGSPIEAHVVQAGNPSSRDGPLFHACVTAKNLWRVIKITGDPDDPKRSPRIPIEHARAQIAQWGREDPWVKVDIFGEFPPGSLNSLIGPEEIEAACRRSWGEGDISRSPRILGVDVARHGDDWSVVWPRQGLVSFIPQRYRNLDGVLGAEQVNRKWLNWDADACFIDDTGGYGASWIDQLKVLGRSPIPVGFGNRATDERFANKRMEMWWDAVQWIKNGGQMPPLDSPGMRELVAGLTSATYTYPRDGGRMLLEPKDKLKHRLGYSPDDADAFCLTFAQPVGARGYRDRHVRSRMRSDYQPVVAWDRDRGGMQVNYRPHGGH